MMYFKKNIFLINPISKLEYVHAYETVKLRAKVQMSCLYRMVQSATREHMWSTYV
jgi:hypothetical protein